jgi:hypothetical protein
MNSYFDYRTIARLIGKDPLPEQSIRIVEKLFERGQNDIESLSLLTIALKTAWRKVFDLLCSSSVFEISFRLRLMIRILKIADNIAGDESRIANFFWPLFKKGGMNALAGVVIERPRIAYEILSVDGFNHICLICERDLKNCDAFLQFLALVVEKCDVGEQQMEKIAATSIKCVLVFGTDQQRGKEICGTALRLLLRVDAKWEKIMRKVFGNLSTREQQMLVRAVEEFVEKVQIRKNALNLKQFSTRTTGGTRRRSSDDEDWQTLDII